MNEETETSAGEGEGDTETTSWFSEDWRQQIAGDDEKALGQLGRYKTPVDIWNKARALEQRLSSGELKETKPFPAEGTDEEKSAWRSQNGVPESPDQYKLKRDLDDTGKKALDGFFKHAHSINAPNDVVDGLVDYFHDKYTNDRNAMEEADTGRQRATEDALRAEWGTDYRGHMNRIEALVDMFPEGKGDMLLNARLPDGSKVSDNVGAMTFLLDAALSMNPATVLTGDGEIGQIDAVQDELTQIKEVMRKDRKKYDRDPNMQERYRQLLAAQEQHNQRKGAAA